MIDALARSALAGALLLLCSAGAAGAATDASLPIARQNDLVKTYCAACHDDARRVGGLSLEHFDAAQADPTIAAMLLSKLTNGLTLETVKAADGDPDVMALVDKEVKTSAIFAAGVQPPDATIVRAWISALSNAASGATAWTSSAPSTEGTAASLVREVPIASDAAKANIYRLAVACNPDTRAGEITLTWAPGDLLNGREVSATADGDAPVTQKLAVTTWKGNRGPTRGIGSVVLYSSRGNETGATLTALPGRTLSVANLMNDQSVTFPFSDLAPATRQALSACFAPGNAAQ
jgi:hypothetical protein